MKTSSVQLLLVKSIYGSFHVRFEKELQHNYKEFKLASIIYFEEISFEVIGNSINKFISIATNQKVPFHASSYYLT